MICSSESEIERENRMIRLFKAKQVDGIIVAPTKVSKIEIQNLVKEGYPLVLFDRYFPEMQTNYIIIDNEGSCYELVKKMIDNGSFCFLFLFQIQSYKSLMNSLVFPLPFL